ncbi:ROK family glucokinase [Bacillaceae bacterium S4-13-58]
MSSKLYIGVDIGGTSVKIAFIHDDGTILAKWEIPTRIENNGQYILTDIASSINEHVSKYNLDKSKLVGCGVGAPGFVDSKEGFVYQAVNIGWKNFDLSNRLKALISIPVFVENDANLAALGENWMGSGRQSNDLMCVTLGTGVGAGIISNGVLISGANGTGGEIGHITVNADGAPCNCGRNGCLETVASATGIIRLAIEALNRPEAGELKARFEAKGELTAKDVFDAAKNQDQKALEIVEYITKELGLSLSNLAIALNPERIVIGGGVSKAGQFLLDGIEKWFNHFSLGRTKEAVKFVIASLGNDAGVYGGAYLVKQNLKSKEIV